MPPDDTRSAGWPQAIFLITRSFNVPGFVDEYHGTTTRALAGVADSSAQVPAPTPIAIVSGVTVAS